MARLKNNPERVCWCCGKKIITGSPKATYCKKCQEVFRDISGSLYQAIRNTTPRKKYPDYAIDIKLRIIKRQNC